jgi:hypothetical protein
MSSAANARYQTLCAFERVRPTGAVQSDMSSKIETTASADMREPSREPCRKHWADDLHLRDRK